MLRRTVMKQRCAENILNSNERTKKQAAAVAAAYNIVAQNSVSMCARTELSTLKRLSHLNTQSHIPARTPSLTSCDAPHRVEIAVQRTQVLC